MSGILGFVGSDPAPEPVAAAMAAGLSGRGPRFCGIRKWACAVLGRRIPAFDRESGDSQPALSPCRSLGVVFEGAIYNSNQLRGELERAGYCFRSRSDAEVILHGYDAWGVDRLASELHGVFAIAIWDDRSHTLYLVRDRLGVKPLVYGMAGDSVAFASSVRAAARSGFAGPVDAQAVMEFLDCGFVTDGRCWYENLHKVPAATIVEFCCGAVRVRKYWAPSRARPDGAVAFRDAVEETERLLLNAAGLRLPARGPVGLLLSGGVDSSLVAWAAAKLGGNIRAFTIGPSGDPLDETARAAETARQLGISHSAIPISDEDAPDVGELNDAYGEPFACGSALGMLRLSRAVRSEAGVVLTGDGGDDCFLGYPEHRAFHLAERAARHIPAAAARLWRTESHRSSLPAPLRKAAHFLDFATGGIGAVARVHDGWQFYARHGLLGPRLERLPFARHSIPPALESARNLSQEFLDYDRNVRLTGEYTTKVDGAAARHGLDFRSPFLDQEVWNFAQSLPFGVRLNGGRLKAVLRDLAARHLGPRVAQDRKQGFSVPVNRWLCGAWKEQFMDLMSGSRLAADGWLRTGKTRQLLIDASARGSAPNQLWYIYVLESWMRREQQASAAGA